MGELHLDIIVDRLRREYKVECDVGAPQVLPNPNLILTTPYPFLNPEPDDVLPGLDPPCSLSGWPVGAPHAPFSPQFVRRRAMGHGCQLRRARSAGAKSLRRPKPEFTLTFNLSLVSNFNRPNVCTLSSSR